MNIYCYDINKTNYLKYKYDYLILINQLDKALTLKSQLGCNGFKTLLDPLKKQIQKICYNLLKRKLAIKKFNILKFKYFYLSEYYCRVIKRTRTWFTSGRTYSNELIHFYVINCENINEQMPMNLSKIMF